MSVATEVSSTLFWHPFEGSVDKEPLFVQYNKYDAQSYNLSDISWYVESPASGVLLDNEVWIRYTIQILDGDTYGNSLRAAYTNQQTNAPQNAAIPINNTNRTGFRFGSVLQKACQNIMLNINGTVMTYEFCKYHDAFNRLYIAKEESETAYPSYGGGFDDGSHQGNYNGYFEVNSPDNAGPRTTFNDGDRFAFLTTDGKQQVGVNADNPICFGQYTGDNHKIVNYGFTRRADFFEYLWRTEGSITNAPIAVKYDDSTLNTSVNGNAVRYDDVVTFVFYEKLAISPFHCYDNRDIKMSIPNIRTFELTFQIHSNWKALMLRACGRDDLDFSISFVSQKPQLLMRWYTPPPGYQIPKQVTLPITKMLTYTQSDLDSIDASSNNFSYPKGPYTYQRSNIALPAMPDLFLIFIKRKIQEYTYNMPDDYNLSIYSLQIDLEGNSGKLISSEPIHLWNMYRRHLRLYPCSRDDFDSWYKYHCVLPITPSDLGVIKGAGMDNPIQVTISNLQYLDYHCIPSINNFPGMTDAQGFLNYDKDNTNINFEFHMVCIYDKYALTLTSDGSSALQLLRVNTMGTSTVPPSGGGGPSSLADIAV